MLKFEDDFEGIIKSFLYSFVELLDHYQEGNDDYTDCQGTMVMLSRTTEVVRQHLPDTETFELLCELQRDVTGFNSLVQKDRDFIRQGCLLKHSKRGLQQRMFFLVWNSASPLKGNQTT